MANVLPTEEGRLISMQHHSTHLSRNRAQKKRSSLTHKLAFHCSENTIDMKNMHFAVAPFNINQLTFQENGVKQK